ncbi:MAG TPA: hypothetical protein VFV99_12775 [Kofleriaceae bacterium]|nr:hypothetical protein [Kofleriaceae bacterium]
MSGPKRNPDKLNTIGVVVVGICGAVLVYVTIVALQAFYMNNTSEIQTMADYGGQDLTAKGRKADEMRNITEAGKNSVGPGQEATFRIPIQNAMQKIVEDAKADPSHLIPALPPSTKPSIEPVFGRPKALGAAPAPEAGSAAGSAAEPPSVPMSPTGAPTGPQPVPGAAGAAGAATPTPVPTNVPQMTTTPQPGQAPKAGGAAQPKAPAQPKADAKAPAQPKADAKAPAQPKADAAKGSAQPKTP